MAEVFRLILFTPRPGMGYPEGGSYDTGANYGGCSQANAAACDPQQFAHLQDAVNYAKSKNETPVRVNDESQVWAILNGQQPITDNMIVTDASVSNMFGNMSPLMIGAIALGAIFILPKLLGGSR